MYNVSSQYRTDMSKTLRNESYMRVRFGVVDPQARDDASITSNSDAPFSNTSSVKNELLFVSNWYDTLEHNQFILDESKHLLDGGESIYQGYVSNSYSNSNCQFTTPPKLTCNYTGQFTLSGLTLTFDEPRGDYCSNITIKAYNNSTLVFDKNYNVDSVQFIVNDSIPIHTKFEVQFNKTSLPNKRVRFSTLAFGLTKLYDESVLTSTSHIRKTDILSSTQPMSSFSFTFIDINNEYNPENPTGLYSYIEQLQPIKFEYGYKLDTGEIEWVLGGNNFTTGEVSFDSNGSIPQVTIKTESKLYYLDEVYNKSEFIPSGRSLKAMAIDMLSLYDIPYTIDNALDSIISTTPLPKQSVKNNLQLIANAGLCTLDIGRDGSIKMNRWNINSTPVFNLDLDSLYSMPTTTKIPSLKNVITSYRTYTVNPTTEEIGKVDILGANNTPYFFDYDLATNVSVSVTGLSIIGTPKYYAYGCEVTLTGTGTVIITGKKISFTNNTLSTEYQPIGVDCQISNELITSTTNCVAYSNWVASVLLLPNQYSIENRGFPEVDNGDIITIDTLYNSDLPVVIVENSITYNGSIRGNSKAITTT